MGAAGFPLHLQHVPLLATRFLVITGGEEGFASSALCSLACELEILGFWHGR